MTVPRLLQFSLLVAGLVGLVNVAQAQGVGSQQLLLSVLPQEPGSTSEQAKGGISEIALRPNAALPFYIYVENGSAAWKPKLFVQVSSDQDGKELLAEGTVENLTPNQRVAVKLTPAGSLKPAAPPPVAPAPAAPPPADDPKTPPPLPGATAPATVYVRLLRALNDATPFATASYNVRLARPREYVDAKARTDSKTGTLTVTLSHRTDGSNPNKILRGAPVKARLILGDDLLANIDPTSLKDGTYATSLPPLGQNVTLVANKLRFTGSTPATGRVLLTLDDYGRAYVFRADFSGTTANEDPKKSVRIDCPLFAVPGKPFAARLEVFNDPPPQEGRQAKPVLRFFRDGMDKGEPEIVTNNLTTARDQAIKLDVGKGGELSFATRVRDWEVPLDTAEIYGPRKLSFTLELDEKDRDFDPKDNSTDLEKRGRLPSPTADTTVTFDDTPPTDVKVLDLFQPKRDPKAKKDEKDPPLELRVWKKDTEKPRIIRGTRVQFVLSAEDRESQIASMLVFTGAPPLPDGKPGPGGKIYTLKRYMVKGADGKDVPSDPAAFTTIIEMPDVKGPFAINYRIFNRAGLMTEDVAEVMLEDPPPPPTTGTIEGKVIQGSTPERPQPGLPVVLFDAGGKAVASTTTSDAGEFKFEDLLPGPYVVFCNKEADQNANDRKPASVKAGDTTTVTLELKR